jgi:hypothetical protein
MNFDYTQIVTLIILFFLIPIIIIGIKNKKNLDYSLKSLVYMLNWAIILQVLVGGISFVLFIIFGEEIVHKIFSRNFHSNASYATIWFIIIAVFYYLPCLGVLNIINLIIKRKKASR